MDVASERAIGTWGTTARLMVGGALVGSVVHGSISGDRGFEPAAWLVGLVALPLVLLAWQVWRSRRTPDRHVTASGPAGHLLTAAVFLILYATPWYAPSLGFTSDAALLFFGSSMLLAAYRGYSGCEVLAVSNWLLRREDQLGCVLFDPVDTLEGSRD